MKKTSPPSRRNLLGSALQRYFCQYLIGQRNLSPHTINAYRDTFRLLIRFLEQRHRKKADDLYVEDLDAPRILAFLDDLERRRGNGARSRNARLAAIRSFIRYTASVELLLLPVAQRLLAIPVKRFEHRDVKALSREQMQSLLEAPNPSTQIGLRDRVLLILMYNTVHVFRRSQTFPLAIFNWTAALRFTSKAKGASSAQCRCGGRQCGFCDSGSS